MRMPRLKPGSSMNTTSPGRTRWEKSSWMEGEMPLVTATCATSTGTPSRAAMRSASATRTPSGPSLTP